MCRNIKNLFNYDPPASDEEIRASSLQFVRKLSGFQKPSQVNEVVFQRALDKVSLAARELIDDLVASTPAKNREEEQEKARQRNIKRFSQS